MMQPLRRAHFRIWLILPAILVLLWAAGLASRRTAAPVNPAVHWEAFQ